MIPIPTNIPWRVIAALTLGACLFFVGWVVNGWHKDAEIAELTAARTQADDYLTIQSTLGAKVDAAVKEFRNAKKFLSVDCRPVDFRVRKLSDAVDAAQQAAAAR